MGIPDNMLHTESTKMISLSNNSRLDVTLENPAMENDHGASRASPPKRRLVSAVRDLPPGCGRLSLQMFSMAKEEVVHVGSIGCTMGGDKTSAFESEPQKVSQNLIFREVSEAIKHASHVDSKAKEQPTSCDDVGKQESTSPAQKPLPDDEVVEALDNEAFMSRDSNQVDVASTRESMAPGGLKSHLSPIRAPNASSDSMEKLMTRNYPPRRIVSGARTFPPFCGMNAPPLVKAHCVEKEKSCFEDKLLKKTDGTVVDAATLKRKVEISGTEVRDKAEFRGKVVKKVRKEGEVLMSLVSTKKVDKDSRGKCVDNGKVDKDSRGKCVDNGENLEENTGQDMADIDCLVRRLVGKYSPNDDFGESKHDSDKEVVLGLPTPYIPKTQRKTGHKLDTVEERKDFKMVKPLRYAAVREKKREPEHTLGTFNYSKSTKEKLHEGTGELVLREEEDNIEHDQRSNEGTGQLVVWDGEDSIDNHESRRAHTLHVDPPPRLGAKGGNSEATVTRSKVKDALRLFQCVCRRFLQGEEARPNVRRARIDLEAAKVLKANDKYVNTGKQIIGPVPGVEVGDEFHYRVELAVVGLHRQYQGGIDYLKQGKTIVATSIVASGGYNDDLDSSDALIYTGQGGNMAPGGDNKKQPEDQKLERGNLSLANSKDKKIPVRVIRGEPNPSDGGKTYVYDGLYLVDTYWQDVGQHGKLIYKFRLVRIPGQPELAWKVVNKSKKTNSREGVCMNDISHGREVIPICAVNTIDDEKPPQFEYTRKMIYPDWCRPIPPKGCNCKTRCSESRECPCVTNNGGEIPYNHNGAIVLAKSLVYECGPNCSCPPSCYNRVSQHGIKFQLEIFKTESRGWGVRSINSILSGSFICEYAGELLDDKEAEQRTGNDEYLFDIGDKYDNGALNIEMSTIMPDVKSTTRGVVNLGFTIDAAKYGNVGRFINHSCSPNLYAQNILYDHKDCRIPHIMLFAADNIPPLQELTYDYNYMIDEVQDSNGNIKVKNCYCGSSECTGRLY